jgi:transposase
MERYVGVDLGIRTKHRAAVLDGAERRGKTFSVEVSREGFETLLARATEGVEGPVHFVLEPTGVAWLPLAAYMDSAGHHVYLVKPQKASDLRKFLRKHTKTDSVDAETLARLPQTDPEGVHKLAVPTADQTALRRLVKRRDRRTCEIGDSKRRIHAVMVMANPPLMDALGEEKFGRATMAFFRTYADPEKVVKRGRSALRAFWRRHSRGQGPQADRVYDACHRTVELYRDLRAADRLPFDYAEVEEELKAEIERIERTEQDVRHLEGQITEMYRKLDPAATLEQLQGIGPVIAPTIEALVGQVLRFANGRRFVSYCGLCPRKSKSGFTDPHMPMTKTGQRLLKKYLYLAADTARRSDPDFAAYYGRRYARGDHHNRILIALARKMALRVYALLKRREQARMARELGYPAEEVSYVLRSPEGRPLDKKEARTLIVQKLARGKVAPQRHARDRARKGKKTEAPRAANEWPPEDATSGSSAPPSEVTVACNR